MNAVFDISEEQIIWQYIADWGISVMSRMYKFITDLGNLENGSITLEKMRFGIQ